MIPENRDPARETAGRHSCLYLAGLRPVASADIFDSEIQE